MPFLFFLFLMIAPTFIQAETVPRDLHIAVLLPLSGQQKNEGNTALNALLIASEDFGNKGISLTIHDTESNPTVTQNLVKTMIQNPQLDLILGTFSEKTAESASHALENSPIPLISFAPYFTPLRNNDFTMAPNPTQESEALNTYMAKNGLRRNVVIFADDTPYGKKISALFSGILQQSTDMTAPPTHFFKLSDESHISQTIKNLTNFEERQTTLKMKISELKKNTSSASIPTLRYLEKKRTLDPSPIRSALIISDNIHFIKKIASYLNFYDSGYPDTQFLGFLPQQHGNEEKLLTDLSLKGALFVTPRTNKYLMKKFKQFFPSYTHVANDVYDSINLIYLIPKNQNPLVFPQNKYFDGFNGRFEFLSNRTLSRELEIIQILGNGTTKTVNILK